MASFSCSIPPLFVLSHSMPMINTTGKLASFGAFLSPLAPSLRIHWPQFSRHSRLATRHSQLPPTTLPRWLLPATNRRIAKDRMGPIWPSGPSILLCTEPGDSCGQVKPFFQLAADQPLAILTWHEAIHASGSRRACLIHINREACSLVVLRDLPEFAQAVSYGVPGTKAVRYGVPGTKALPSGHTSPRWGFAIRSDDGRVILDPDPWEG